MSADRGQPTVALDQAGPMPLVGLGTWQMTGARCQAAVRYALEVGYRHIDTAAIYRNEREVGRAVRDGGIPREQLFVTTKLPPGDAGRERRTLDNSLRALGIGQPPPMPGRRASAGEYDINRHSAPPSGSRRSCSAAARVESCEAARAAAAWRLPRPLTKRAVCPAAAQVRAPG